MAGLTDGFNAKESTVKVGREMECSVKDGMTSGTTEKGAVEKVTSVDAA